MSVICDEFFTWFNRERLFVIPVQKVVSESWHTEKNMWVRLRDSVEKNPSEFLPLEFTSTTGLTSMRLIISEFLRLVVTHLDFWRETVVSTQNNNGGVWFSDSFYDGVARGQGLCFCVYAVVFSQTLSQNGEVSRLSCRFDPTWPPYCP